VYVGHLAGTERPVFWKPRASVRGLGAPGPSADKAEDLRPTVEFSRRAVSTTETLPASRCAPLRVSPLSRATDLRARIRQAKPGWEKARPPGQARRTRFLYGTASAVNVRQFALKSFVATTFHWFVSQTWPTGPIADAPGSGLVPE
jgi:hypothetical protein